MPIKTIVVGTDLGESGHRAMRLAIATARATHATLWLVHASDMGLEHAWPDLPVGARSAAQALRERLKGRFENSLQELESERKACEDLGLSCQTSSEEGRPWETILRTAVSVNADLIAVGDPAGAIGLPERLLGSTAERVVRQAPCSVLVSCGRLRADYSGARIAVGVDFRRTGSKRCAGPVMSQARSAARFRCSMSCLTPSPRPECPPSGRACSKASHPRHARDSSSSSCQRA